MIYIATDHAWFELKNKIVDFLKSKNIEVTDMWPYKYDALDDYPDFIIPAAQKVWEKPEENRAIILWGSGQWEAISANKVKWVRAAVYYWWPVDIVNLSILHNNANILSLWSRFIDEDEILSTILLWLSTDYINEERHTRRIEKISTFENINLK